MEHKFEQTHNFYSVEDSGNKNNSIDVKHNIECLDKLLQSVDKVLEKI